MQSAVQRHDCNGAVPTGSVKHVVKITPSSLPPENLNKPSPFHHFHPCGQKPYCSRSALLLSSFFITFPYILSKRSILANCLLSWSWPCLLSHPSWLVNKSGLKSCVWNVTVRVTQTLGKVFAAVAISLGEHRWTSLYLALALIW